MIDNEVRDQFMAEMRESREALARLLKEHGGRIAIDTLTGEIVALPPEAQPA